MDWLLVGDLRGMVRERWRQYGVDPDMPLPALAHRDTRVEALGDQLNKSNRQLAELREQFAALRNELAELRGEAAMLNSKCPAFSNPAWAQFYAAIGPNVLLPFCYPTRQHEAEQGGTDATARA